MWPTTFIIETITAFGDQRSPKAVFVAIYPVDSAISASARMRRGVPSRPHLMVLDIAND